MTEFAASNLRIANQTYNPNTDEVSVTFAWDRGSSEDGNIIVQQILYVSSFNDFTCGEFGRVCQDVGFYNTSFTITNIGPNTLIHYLVGTLFNQGDLNNPFLTLFSEVANVTTIGANAPPPPPTDVDHGATNLQVTSQSYDPIQDTNKIHVIWDIAQSDNSGHFISVQFLDITPTIPNAAPNWNCNDFGVMCFQEGPFINGATVEGAIDFSTSYTYRINTLWDRSSTAQDAIWVESQYAGFLSAAKPVVVVSARSILPHTLIGGQRGILPRQTFDNAKIHIMPYFPGVEYGPPGLPDGGGDPPLGPPGPPIHGDVNQVARYALNFWGRDAAIIMVAIAGAESCGWQSDVLGDRWEDFVNGPHPPSELEKTRSCFSTVGGCSHNLTGHWWSHGLYQINMNAHYDVLPGWVGNNNPCSWADWLHDPQNNTFAANYVSSGGTDFWPWTTYQTGAYLVYIPTATTAVDFVLNNG